MRKGKKVLAKCLSFFEFFRFDIYMRARVCRVLFCVYAVNAW